jgi:hypothetical protein
MRRACRALLLPPLLLLPGGCHAAPRGGAAVQDQAFAWTVGAWEGVRIDGADGSRAPMAAHVVPILGGAGLIEELTVQHERGAYRGFTVQAFDVQAGRWVRQYVNGVQGRFVRLEREVEAGAAGARSTWRVASPERTRESRLVSEQRDDGTWVRTMHASEDAGQTWRELWRDELRRR